MVGGCIWIQSRMDGRLLSLGVSLLYLLVLVPPLLYLLEHLAAWPVRMLQQHPVKLWLGGSGVMLGVTVCAALYSALREWLGGSWKLAVTAQPASRTTRNGVARQATPERPASHCRSPPVNAITHALPP